ncbi:MAG: hypothetical protein ABIB41_00470 [Nitrospirota bacterium]
MVYQRNIMVLTVLLLFVICFFSFYADAEEKRWDLYYTDPDGTEHYYDLKNITRTSKVIIESRTSTRKRIRNPKKYTKALMVKVREKLVFNNPKYLLKESRILREFDCSKNITRILMISETHKNGFKKIEGKVQPWESINSKPSYEALFEIACKP